MTPRFLPIAGLLPLTLALACSSSDSKEKASDAGTEASSDAAANVAPATQASLTEKGEYGVATLDITLTDSTRRTPANGSFAGAPDRTLDTTIWYPATDDGGPVAGSGPFPIIGYAHGFLSSKAEAADVKAHLASHGYIVVAPTFPLSNGSALGGTPTFKDMANQPGDVAFVMKQVATFTGEHSDLAAAVDGSRRGMAGLSLGGATTILGVYHPKLHLDGIQAAVAYAPAAFFFGPALYVHALPTLILNGSADELVPFDTIVSGPQEYAPPPLRVAKVVGGTHVGFMGLDLHPPDGGNSDQIGCDSVQGAVGTNVDPATYQELVDQLTDGADGGAVNSSLSTTVCATKYPQTMSGERQLELTKAATLAHFEAILRGRKDAAAYLSRSFDADNDDIEVTRDE